MEKKSRKRDILERILPPNVDPDRTGSWITGVLTGGVLASVLGFILQYSGELRRLYYYDSVRHVKTLIEGAEVSPFTSYVFCAGGVFLIFALLIAAWTVSLYGSFSRGSRSLYLIRRLPEGHKPLLDYVLRAPALCIAGAAAVCAVLLGGYYLLWRFMTPEICLPH